MPRSTLLTVLALVLVLAGCGRSTSPYTVKGTKPCLEKNHFRVSTRADDLGFVAAAAPNGGLRAFTKGEANVTIAFGETAAYAPQFVAGVRRFASKALRPHLGDIVQTQRNAGLLWSIAPTPLQLQTVLNCLGS